MQQCRNTATTKRVQLETTRLETLLEAFPGVFFVLFCLSLSLPSAVRVVRLPKSVDKKKRDIHNERPRLNQTTLLKIEEPISEQITFGLQGC